MLMQHVRRMVAAAALAVVVVGGGQAASGQGMDSGMEGGEAVAEAEGKVNPADYDFFEDFSDGVGAQWLVATWKEHNTQMSNERAFVKDGKLHLVFINDADEGYLGGALQTQRDDFGYGRWEARLKPSSVPGVLNSMYTIDWRDNGKKTRQEIDIEFLTYKFNGEHPGEVWFAQHAAGKKSKGVSVPLDFDPSEDFHIWGFEITPTHIEYFVDDTVLYRYVYADEDITFDAPYMLKFNVWSQEKWINGPPKADVPTVYEIDWVRFKAREE